jgi:hypothetical protein
VIGSGTPQVVSYRPDMSNPRYLATLGPVGALNYSYALPGGCDQMQCTLFREPNFRTDAMDPGRVVQLILGGSVIWDGHMLEPSPAPGGWTITAVGTAAWATNFRAVYTSAWGSGVADNIVNAAIVRGLRWTNPGIGNPSQIWYGQQVDSAAQTVTDMLNLITSNGGMTWYVAPKGNTLTVFTLPTAVNRILVATSPIARTLGGNLNRVYERYQNTLDNAAGTGAAATYALTHSDDAASQSQFGSPLEDYVDLSSVGVITAGAAQTVGNLILTRYQRASFAAPFQVTPGQLLTSGGQPVDLAQEQAGTVCKLMVTDYPYAGEQAPGQLQFLVGEYQFDVDSQTATVTPFQSLDMSESSILSAPWTTVDTRADVKFQRHERAVRSKNIAAAKRRAAARAKARAHQKARGRGKG